MSVSETRRFDPTAPEFLADPYPVPAKLRETAPVLWHDELRRSEPRSVPFADPDRFDVARANAAEHIGFGGGIPVCIGAPLARVELEARRRALVERGLGLELVEEPRRTPAFVIWASSAWT